MLAQKATRSDSGEGQRGNGNENFMLQPSCLSPAGVSPRATHSLVLFSAVLRGGGKERGDEKGSSNKPFAIQVQFLWAKTPLLPQSQSTQSSADEGQRVGGQWLSVGPPLRPVWFS